MNPIILAEFLLEQPEVREFVAKNILPEQLSSTITLASRLSDHLVSRAMQSQHLRKDSTQPVNPVYEFCEAAFLDVWETFVYPVLKSPTNHLWAEKWRGGHITNMFP